jgi:trehalose 6-phosphate phosphatase
MYPSQGATVPDRSANPSPSARRRLGELPPARPARELLGERVRGRAFAVFLDYDGTLTPIVDDPDDARLTPTMRATIEALAASTVVAVVSGRDLTDVRTKVGIDGLAYAGSHGLDILRRDGSRQQLATDHLHALDLAEQTLERRLPDAPGVRIERKRFAIAVHDRQVDDAAVRSRIAEVVEGVGDEHPELRVTGGKRIHELRPDIDWDKGRAIETLLVELDAEDRVPIYLGDDLTDEDGFRAVKELGGVAVVVRGEDDDRSTTADAALDTTEDAGRFLDELLELVEDGPAAPPRE